MSQASSNDIPNAISKTKVAGSLQNKTTAKNAKPPIGFKNTTKEYEPELSDEALENMVPPPKRRFGEDTPLVDMS